MIIGIAGVAGSGKTTAGNVLVELGYTRGKFANALKEMLRTLLRYRGCDAAYIESCIEGHLKERPLNILGGKSPRHAMQSLGAWGRNDIESDFWVDVEFDQLRGWEKILFDDLRHDNEEAAIIAAGGTVLHIIGRGGIEGTHFSESFKPHGAYVIRNTGTVEDLQENVRQFVRDLSWATAA